MLRTLRGRLIVSHVLPLLLALPLLGIVLVYVLETRVLLVNLARQLSAQGVLVAELAREYPGVWQDPAQARLLVDRVGPLFPAQLMILDGQGRVLASSDPSDASLQGQVLPLAEVDAALAGAPQSRVAYSQNARAEVADVLVPATSSDGGRVQGLVRLTDRFGSVYGRFRILRSLIAEFVALALLLGAAAGLILAINLERPLQHVAGGVQQLSHGGLAAPLTERGPREIRQIARELNLLSERLERLEEVRRYLLANLVHELGRPLGALRAATRALLDGAAEEPVTRQELLEGMDSEVHRLQGLMENLDEFHDQVLGSLKLDRHRLALGEWLPPVLSPWRSAARQAGLRWEAPLPDALPAVEADHDRLAQALGNLLSNAIKYNSKGGLVRVEAGQVGPEAWIRVSDTGPGMAPDEQERILEPFYRARPARQAPEGMGLGLTIARDLVVAHGGRLEVESSPGAGARFTIWLPAQKIA
jgi:two-component system sensor histidine kinase BaeS